MITSASLVGPREHSGPTLGRDGAHDVHVHVDGIRDRVDPRDNVKHDVECRNDTSDVLCRIDRPTGGGLRRYGALADGNRGALA